MGLFQGFIDKLYLTQCAKQMQVVAPMVSEFAVTFCLENADKMLKNRKDGFNVESAVGITCMMLLDSPSRKMESTTGLGPHSLTIAANYALCAMAKWPGSGINESFKESLGNYKSYVDNHPITKDLEANKARMENKG